MTRAEIKAFLAVVAYGSISRAAEKLFIRQSTLSGRLRTLEAELKETLFKRGRGIRSTELTAFGASFVAIAEKWEQLWQETLAAADQRQSRILCTAAIQSVNTYVLTDVYGLFAARFPDVRLRLLIRHSDEAYHLIESGGAEAAFVTKPQYSKRIESIPMFTEKMLLVCNKRHPAARTVRPTDLDRSAEVLLDWHREYLQWHDYWFGETGVPRLFTDDMSVMEKFLETDRCWSVMPVSVARTLQRKGRVQVRRLVTPPPDRQVFMIKLKATNPSPELRALLTCLEEVVARQGAEWVYRQSTNP